VAHEVIFSPDANDHFEGLPKYQRAKIVDAIEKQLLRQPQVETRNRKPLRPNPLAPWELRVGNLRVFYDVIEQPRPTVVIIAIGIKERGQLIIGGEEIQL
jgi:mRNA-degrading endonuclease RelE of RelBE toxin-antitoxin system